MQPATIDEFKKVVLTRSKLADVCAAPWFDKWVKGALFVRFLCSLFLTDNTLCRCLGPLGDRVGQRRHEVQALPDRRFVSSLSSEFTARTDPFLIDTKARPERSYRLENTRTNIFVELQHAKTRFWQNLELVSNGEPSDVRSTLPSFATLNLSLTRSCVLTARVRPPEDSVHRR